MLISVRFEIKHVFAETSEEQTKVGKIQYQPFQTIKRTHSNTNTSPLTDRSSSNPQSYIAYLQFALSGIVIIADILMFILYSLLIYFVT